MEWRVLVVDDKDADDVVEMVEKNKVVPEPDFITCVTCKEFSQAIELLNNQRFDLVILDLKDDGAEEQETLAGESVFEGIKQCRFVPVIFHTGYAHKVSSLKSPYVKVVTRSEWENLRSSIKEVLDTKLPKLMRHIEEEQRRFMWESAEKIWKEDLNKENTADLVYLLARRLANTLSGDVVRSFLNADGTEAPVPDKIHSVELYVYPPLTKHHLFGDIFKKNTEGNSEYFVALTPSCDHAHCKADFVLLAKCEYLADTEVGRNAKTSLDAEQEVSNGKKKELKEFISDHSKPVDRYKYLPGTSFLPDLLVDLQNVMTVPPAELNNQESLFKRVASLDSPFAEALQSKVTRYLGRIGTPDIDSDLALTRFFTRIKAS